MEGTTSSGKARSLFASLAIGKSFISKGDIDGTRGYCLEINEVASRNATRHRFSWKYLRNGARLISENRTPVCRVELKSNWNRVEKCPCNTNGEKKKKTKKTKQSFIKERLKKGKSVFKKNIQSGIPRSDIGSVCHITKEEKIKDSGNKTSLWLVIFVRVVYIGYIIVVSNSRRGGYILK